MTSSALDGECKEFQTEDGNQEESQRLSACAAWVQDQEEDDENDLEEFVMEQVGITPDLHMNFHTVESSRVQRFGRKVYSLATKCQISDL